MTNESGLEFEGLPSDAQRRMALDALSWLIISLDMSHEAWCDSASWRDDFIEKCDIIRAALQSTRVPVIPGLDDAIASCVRYQKTNEIGFLTPADRDNVLKAARAYAELQKEVIA